MQNNDERINSLVRTVISLVYEARKLRELCRLLNRLGISLQKDSSEYERLVQLWNEMMIGEDKHDGIKKINLTEKELELLKSIVEL